MAGGDLLWDPTQGPRGDDYIAITPEVTQEVHALTLSYEVDRNRSIRVVVPHIRQRTDHKTVIPGWNAFVMRTDGLGDVVVTWEQVIARRIDSEWRLAAGVSAPVGSIEKEGATPRGYGQLPYNMQMGSGTWDIPVQVSWTKQTDTIRWGITGGALYRIGDNDRGYTLGNRMDASIWALTAHWRRLEPGLRLSWHWQDSIEGVDPEMPEPDPRGRYPTPAVDPTKYGGQRIELGGFVRAYPTDGRDWFVDLEGGVPLYQNLNGPQLGSKWRFGLRIGTEF